jgi:hypothetical protein
MVSHTTIARLGTEMKAGQPQANWKLAASPNHQQDCAVNLSMAEVA